MHAAAPSPGLRVAAALLLLTVAALLLRPGPAPTAPVSWDDLIRPYAVGAEVTRGFVLAPPRRGAVNDVVYTLRREAGENGPAARVEVHVLDRGRWKNIAETRSFGVAWEVPPPGATLAASRQDSQAVTDALVAAIAANDTGFAAVDTIPLAGEATPPAIVRTLARLSDGRGVAISAALLAALLLLGSLRGGTVVAAAFLFALGLALRAPELDLPFAHAQDVHRLFTGNSSLADIATGVGLKDRHPPLYFFILHFAQWRSQSEAAGRAPAVVAGALVGPALLAATAAMNGSAGPAALLVALAVTISPELIARSREVSEIPLYALFVIAAVAALVAALHTPRPARLIALALSHALALFTYYLAPFLVAANAATLLWRRAPRRVAAAFAAGIAIGSPALLLGAVTLVRDWGARDVARAFPGLAWGEHSPLPMASLMIRIAADTFGPALFALLAAGVAVGCLRRRLAVVAPALAAAVTFAGIALLSPIARVQGYYVTTVLPAAALALAALPLPIARPVRIAWIAALGAAVTFSTLPRLAAAGALYSPDTTAFMPRFAAAIATRPETTVVTVAHYDQALLGYYLARNEGRRIAWHNLNEPHRQRVLPLVLAHSLGPGSEDAALQRLAALTAAEPILVVENESFLLPRVVTYLDKCEELRRAPNARLLRCARSAATAQ